MARTRKDEALGASLRAARRASGLSQAAAAKAAGLTQAHVSLIERGMDAHLSIFQRAAAAVDAELRLETQAARVVPAPYGGDEIANRLYLLGRLAAKRLTAKRLAEFRDWIARAQSRLGDYPYFRRWLEIINEGPDSVAAMLTNRGEAGRYMRSVATFRPFVSQAERDAYFRRELPPDGDSH